MRKRLGQKIAVATSGVCLTASLAYASCGGTEGMVVLEVQAMVQMVAQAMFDGAISLIKQSIFNTDRTLSAMKVVVKQEAVSSEKKMVAMRGAGEALATSYAAQKTSEQVYDIYNRYRSQGFDPCKISVTTKQLKKLEVKAGDSVSTRVAKEIDAAPGRFERPEVAMQRRVEEHKKYFCTQEEKEAGVCAKVGELPGGDSNASLLFVDAKSDSVETKAKNAFINNLFGLPADPRQFKGQSAEAQSVMSSKHRIDAMNSIPMFSMKTIQADHEIDPATGKSYAGALRERIGMYFGTETSQKWAQSLAAQEQRGILVDMVKMEGMALKLAQRRIMQNARIEGNLAGLVALSAERFRQ